MLQFDAVLRRILRRIRETLPGPTTASRLMRQSNSWRNVPLHQRPAAYAQFMHTQHQLKMLHIGQKIAPKIVDLLFKGLRSHLAAPGGQLLMIYVIGWLFGLW